MRKREDQSTAFRDALWVSRGVGHAETTPLRLEDVEGLARHIDARTLATGEPLQRAGEASDEPSPTQPRLRPVRRSHPDLRPPRHADQRSSVQARSWRSCRQSSTAIGWRRDPGGRGACGLAP